MKADVIVDEVRIAVDGGEVDGVVFRPLGHGPWPAIVLGAEATGINTFIRGVGEKLAAEGFVAVVFDFFRGAGPPDPDDYSDISAIEGYIHGLDFRQATYDLLSTVDYIRAQPFVAADRVLTWGYCTGGTLSMLAGCLDRTLLGSVLFYPSQPVFDSLSELRPAHPKDLVWNHRAPLMLFYGDQDGAVPNTVQEELYSQLRRWRVDASVTVYPGAGHVFAGKHFRDAHRPDAARDSWDRSIAFAHRQVDRHIERNSK